MSKTPKIGLALGSGGARGLAHIGVIKVLEENNIPIDYIAGTSIGSIIGGFYAAGFDIKGIEEVAASTDIKKIFSLVDPNIMQGLIGGDKIKAFFQSYLGNKKIENCHIPFAAVATDLKTGEIVVIDKGELITAIRASISIPLAFKPVKIHNKTLADGGLSAPVPVEIVRAMGADIVIAVNLDKHHCDESWKPHWFNIAYNSLDILRHHLAQQNCQKADIVIDLDLGNCLWYEFVNGQDKISHGETAAREIMPQIKELIYQKGKTGLQKYFSFFH